MAWNDEEKQFLRSNYSHNSDRELSRMMGRTMYGISNMRHMLGLKKPLAGPIDWGGMRSRDFRIRMPFEFINECGETDEAVITGLLIRRLNEVDDCIMRWANSNVRCHLSVEESGHWGKLIMHRTLLMEAMKRKAA